MLESRKIYVIIAAAGLGKRMAANLPKQFLELNGKTIIERTVDRFTNLPYIDGIIVVTHPDYVDFCCNLLGKVTVVAGGKERQDSVLCGLQALPSSLASKCCETKAPLQGSLQGDSTDIVLIHDGARPFVTEREIRHVIEDAIKYGAAVDAVRTKDTVRMIDCSAQNHFAEGEFAGKKTETGVEEKTETGSVTLDRDRLYNVQTPQGFRRDVLLAAYEKAFAEGFYGTDDGMLVERLGFPVAITEGDYANIKITTRSDLPEAGGTMETRIGTGFDVHRLVEGRNLILGGVKIPFEKGLLGHSDADVLVHALMDAMLGAAALGDIGKHFPDTDGEFEGISSIELLKRVKGILEAIGYCLVNADMTVICQRPKIAGFIEEMRGNIGAALGVDIERISIKGTTTEKLGFTGREEGIACEAVCMLKK